MKHYLLLVLLIVCISTSSYATKSSINNKSDENITAAASSQYSIGIQGSGDAVDTMYNYIPGSAFYVTSTLNLNESVNDKVVEITIPKGMVVENLPRVEGSIKSANSISNGGNGYIVTITIDASSSGFMTFEMGLNVEKDKVYSTQELEIKSKLTIDANNYTKDLYLEVTDYNTSADMWLYFTISTTTSNPKVDVPTQFYTQVVNTVSLFANYTIKDYQLDLGEIEVDIDGDGTYENTLRGAGLLQYITVDDSDSKVSYNTTDGILSHNDIDVGWLNTSSNLPFKLTFPSSHFNDNSTIRFSLGKMIKVKSYENGFANSILPSANYKFKVSSYDFIKSGNSLDILLSSTSVISGVKPEMNDIELFKAFAYNITFNMKDLKFEVNIPAGIEVNSVYAPRVSSSRSYYYGNVNITDPITNQTTSIPPNKTINLPNTIVGPSKFTVSIDSIPIGPGLSFIGGISYVDQGISFIGKASSSLNNFEVYVSPNSAKATLIDDSGNSSEEFLINNSESKITKVNVSNEQVPAIRSRYFHFLSSSEISSGDKNHNIGIGEDVAIRAKLNVHNGYYYGTPWKKLESPVIFINYPKELIPASGSISKADFDIYEAGTLINSEITNVSKMPDSLSVYPDGHVVRLDLANYSLTNTKEVQVLLKLKVKEDLTSGTIYPSYTGSILIGSTSPEINYVEDSYQTPRMSIKNTGYDNITDLRGDYLIVNDENYGDALVISAPVELTFKSMGSVDTINGGTFSRISKNDLESDYPKYHIGEKGLYRFQIYNTLSQDSSINAKGYFVFPDLSEINAKAFADEATIESNNLINVNINYMLDHVTASDTLSWDWVNDNYGGTTFGGNGANPTDTVYGLKWDLIQLPRNTQWKLNIPFEAEYRKTYDPSIYNAHRGVSSYSINGYKYNNVANAGFMITQSLAPTIDVTGITDGEVFDYIDRGNILSNFRTFSIDDDYSDSLVIYDKVLDKILGGNTNDLSDTSKVRYVDNLGDYQTVDFASFANLNNNELGSGEYTFTYTTEQDADAQITSKIIKVTVKSASVYNITYKTIDGATITSLTPDNYTSDDWGSPLPDSSTVISILTDSVGYEFLGWSTSTTGSTYLTSIPNLQEDLTLYAIFASTPYQYSIRYLMTTSHNDITNNIENQFSSYNVTDLPFSLPTANDMPDTIKPYYKLSHWSTNGTDVVTSIPKGTTGDKTFYAIWERISFDINYFEDLLGTIQLTNLSPSTFNMGEGALINAIPKKTNYTFTKWVDSQGNTVDSISYKADSTVNLYAVWKGDDRIITYLDDDTKGNAEITNVGPKTYEIGVGATISAIPTRLNYDFVEWQDSVGNVVTSISNTETQNITLYAVWKGHMRTITYLNGDENNNSIISSVGPTSYEIGKGAKIDAVPTEEYKEFVEWQDSVGNVVDSISKLETNNITLYAVWKGETRTITYLDDSANGHAPLTGPWATYYEIGVGAVIDAIPTKDNYNFVEWQDNLGNTITNISITDTTDTTLYAVWKDKFYTISYIDVLTNEILSGYSNWTYYYTVKDSVDLPTNVSMYNNSFIGWSTKMHVYTPISSIAKGTTGDIKVYAFFDEKLIDKPVIINYYNSSLNPIYTDTISSNQLPYYPTHTLTYNNYVFEGWSLSRSLASSEVVVDNIELDDLNEGNTTYTIDLYASWSEKGHNFAYPSIVTSYFTVEVEKDNNTISLFNANGSLIMSKKMPTTKEKVYVGTIPAGIYILREEETGRTAKIIIK